MFLKPSLLTVFIGRVVKCQCECHPVQVRHYGHLGLRVSISLSLREVIVFDFVVFCQVCGADTLCISSSLFFWSASLDLIPKKSLTRYQLLLSPKFCDTATFCSRHHSPILTEVCQSCHQVGRDQLFAALSVSCHQSASCVTSCCHSFITFSHFARTRG